MLGVAAPILGKFWPTMESLEAPGGSGGPGGPGRPGGPRGPGGPVGPGGLEALGGPWRP